MQDARFLDYRDAEAQVSSRGDFRILERDELKFIGMQISFKDALQQLDNRALIHTRGTQTLPEVPVKERWRLGSGTQSIRSCCTRRKAR